MENKQFNAFKDPGVWIAFVIGGGLSSLALFLQGIYVPALVSLLASLTWMGWIIFKKGAKWSFLTGLFWAFLVSGIAIVVIQNSFDSGMMLGTEYQEKKKALYNEREKQYEKIAEDIRKATGDDSYTAEDLMKNSPVNP